MFKPNVLLNVLLSCALNSIGQLTYDGTVTCSDNWGSADKVKSVNKGMAGSWEDMFHRLTLKTGQLTYSLDVRSDSVRKAIQADGMIRLNRAIGVIYRPQTERQSHYFFSQITQQFDIVVWFDRTNNVQPLPSTPKPFGLAAEMMGEKK